MSTYQEESTTKKPNTDGSGIICGMTTFVFIIMIVAFGIASIPSFHSTEKQCFISNVTYPTEINSNSFSSNSCAFAPCSNARSGERYIKSFATNTSSCRTNRCDKIHQIGYYQKVDAKIYES